MGDEIKITIQRGEGISQAIKRQLISDGANNASFTGNVWAQIQQALCGDATDENTNNNSTFTHNGETKNIGDAWTQLNMNVKVFAGDEISISDETWTTIKGLFVEGGEQNQSVKQKTSQRVTETNQGSKPQVVKENKGNKEVKKAEKTTPQQPVQNNSNTNTQAQTVKAGTDSKYQQEIDMSNDCGDFGIITVKANSQKELKNKIAQINKMKTLYKYYYDNGLDDNCWNKLQDLMLKEIRTGDKDIQLAASLIVAQVDASDAVFDELLATKEPEVIGRLVNRDNNVGYLKEYRANELYALTKDNDFMKKCGENAGWIKGEIIQGILCNGFRYPNIAKEIYKNSSHAMRSEAHFSKETVKEIVNDDSYNLNANDILYLYKWTRDNKDYLEWNTTEFKELLSKLPKNLTYGQVWSLRAVSLDKFARRNFAIVQSGDTIDDTIARHVLDNNIYKKLVKESDAECRALAAQVGYSLTEYDDKHIDDVERAQVYEKATEKWLSTKWSPEQRMQAAKKYAKTYRSAITNKIGLNSKTKTWYGRKTFADLQFGQVLDFSAMNNAWPQPTKIL